MTNSAFAQKFDTIIRLGKQLIRKVDHIHQLLARSRPDSPESEEADANADGNTHPRTIPTNGDGKAKPKQDKSNTGQYFWNWTVAELIQASIGLLLFFTLWYSIRSYNLSVNTRNIQLRAWVTYPKIQIQEPPPKPGDEASVVPVHVGTNSIVQEIKNTGQTPATHVHLHNNPPHVEGIACALPASKTPYTSDVTVGPGEVGLNQDFSVYVTPACLQALQSGEATMTFDGNVTYMTIFGEEHHSWFCVRIEGQASGLLTACPEGNDID